MKNFFAFVLLSLCIGNLHSQNIPRYNHYFAYSYLYNPAFLGRVEASQLNMIYRKQWVGLDGAPEYIHAGLQLPLSQNIAIGLNASNSEQGLINETSAMGSVAYTVNLGINKILSFGISIGAGRTALDVSQIPNLSDPAIVGALDKSFYMEGQAGFSLTLNRLNLSVSLPTIFEKTTLSDQDFQDAALGPLNTMFSSLSYRYDISPMFSIEPMGIYQMDNQLEDQLQGNLTLYYNDLLWLGGNFSDGYGAAAYAGFEVNDFVKIGYSFDFSNNDLSAFNSHEFYVSLKIGKKKVDRTLRKVTKSKPLPIVDSQPERDEAAINEVQSDLDRPIEEQTEEKVDPAKEKKTDVKIEEKVENQKSQPVVRKKPEAAREIENELRANQKEVITELVIDNNPSKKDSLQRGDPTAMASGFYVVIGAFTNNSNAIGFVNELANEGYSAKSAYSSRTKFHYIYLLYTESREEAYSLIENLRNRNQYKFEDAWVLNIK